MTDGPLLDPVTGQPVTVGLDAYDVRTRRPGQVASPGMYRLLAQRRYWYVLAYLAEHPHLNRGLERD